MQRILVMAALAGGCWTGVDFKLEVLDARGDALEVVQPALDLGVYPKPIALAKGAVERLATPIRLRFDAGVAPSGGNDRMLWSIRSAPQPVRLRATLKVEGIRVAPAEAMLEP